MSVDVIHASGLLVRNWVWLWGPPVLLMAGIFGLSAQSRLVTPAVVSDKLVHGLVYGLLAALVLRAVAAADWRRVTVRSVVVAIAVASIYGALDEWHQSFVPNRTPEWGDVLADATGAFVVAGALWWCGIIKRSFEG